MQFLGFLGGPLGAVMSFIYGFIQNYFLTIFLFTLLVRLVLFPLSLKQQKSAMERAKLAPKLERLQKKYANDRQKLAEKQQALYQKHGVSMTGGCLPMILSMIVLFGVIAAIYKPLTYMSNPAVPDAVIKVAQTAVIDDSEKPAEGKIKSNLLSGYYGELNFMMWREPNREEIIAVINDPTKAAIARAYSLNAAELSDESYESIKAEYISKYLTEAGMTGESYYESIDRISDEFNLFGTMSMLKNPWDGLAEGLWLIPLISGLTSFAVSFVSMRYSKRSMPQNQPGQGCSNYSMMIFMPVFSTYIAFTVPGAVGIYWIFSNLLSLVQTVIVNKIYDPAKARAQAEAEYQERRRQKAEDKKRLAQARQREEAEARKAEQELERRREESREMNKKKAKGKGGASASASTEKTPVDENAEQDTDSEQSTDSVENTSGKDIE